MTKDKSLTPLRLLVALNGSFLFVGCGSSTDVSLAKVPPTTPQAAQPVKPFPKNSTHSPAILPGSEQK